MNEFNNKVAVITGAGRGIGRGIALRCGAEGMRVVLAGIGMESLTKTEDDLADQEVSTLVVQTDVSKRAEMERLAHSTLEAFGRVDLLVNNAGVGVYSPILESSLSDWEWVFGVNFWGVLYGVRAFLPRMLEQTSSSHIVNVSSVSGVTYGTPRLASYCASKHAVVSLTESLFFDLSERAPHIKASVYLPGQVDTNIPDADRNRPRKPALDSDDIVSSKEGRDWTKKLGEELAAGKSIEESADILFDGLREEKLYIGIKGFLDQHPTLADAIKQRAMNIVNESNPFF